MVRLATTKMLNEVLESATTFSAQRGLYCVGVEHLFEAIVAQMHELPVEFLSEHELELERTQAMQHQFLGAPMAVEGDVFYAPQCVAILERAKRIADRLNADATAGHALLALLSDSHAAPCRAMDTHGIDRRTMANDLKEDLLHDARRSTPNPFADRQLLTPDTEAAAPAASTSALARFIRDMTEEACAGRLHGAVGYGGATVQLLDVLVRQGKKNATLVGAAGMNMSRIVEGLTLEVAEGKYASIDFDRIVALNTTALLSGVARRNTVDREVQAFLKSVRDRGGTLLFIDEIHLLLEAGEPCGDSTSAVGLLRAALTDGTVRVIGATTAQEYRRLVEQNPEIKQRLPKVRVKPLCAEDTLRLLKMVKPGLEQQHCVRIQPDALETALALSDRYMPDRSQPDKAIDVLEQSCCRAHIRRVVLKHAAKITEDQSGAGLPVTSQDVRKVVSRIVSVPLEQIVAEERVRLTDIERRLRAVIVGQDDAIGTAVTAIKRAREGSTGPTRPDASLLFLGPSGVGKTHLARELARLIFGSPDCLIRFNLSEYVHPNAVARLLGPPPGSPKSPDEGLLATAVRKQPYSVLLFDQIEKASAQVLDILLSILENGSKRDAHGRTVRFRNCILVFASKIGPDESRRLFQSKFIDQLDGIVPFYPLQPEDARAILKKMVDHVRRRLQVRNIGIRMYQRAYEHLAEIGCNRAGELQRAVERLVDRPIADRLLEGEFADGDMIDVLVEDAKLVYRKGAPHAPS